MNKTIKEFRKKFPCTHHPSQCDGNCNKNIEIFLKKVEIDQFREGYNQCLKDEKIPNEFGQKSL